MSYHFLLQGIFPTQGSNLGLLRCRQTLYHLSYQGIPVIIDKFNALTNKVLRVVRKELENLTLELIWKSKEMGKTKIIFTKTSSEVK